ncbi:ABC transporter permease [Hymenobacter humi]|uniref:ABC transporter permease n=1 Tax=Hymenobacter humi TaxID=1411620 RepID=A0ABW2UB41_9BACT
MVKSVESNAKTEMTTARANANAPADGPQTSSEKFEQGMNANGPQTAMTGRFKAFEILGNLPLGTILFGFIIYFLGGYLLYGALFGAVGAAVDDQTDTQQFMLPITMPLILSYIVGVSVILRNPDGPVAFWMSMIPFTSPIAMVIRLPFGVPMWQAGAVHIPAHFGLHWYGVGSSTHLPRRRADVRQEGDLPRAGQVDVLQGVKAPRLANFERHAKRSRSISTA